MTSGTIFLMLILFSALSARYNNGGNWQHHPNNNHNNNQSNCPNPVTELRGTLVRTGNGYDGGFSFNLSFAGNPSAHINYNNANHNNGFGILVKRPGGERSVYQFDRKGDRLARQLLSNRWRHKKNLVVEVRGILNHRTRTIEVVSLERVTGNHYWQSNSHNNNGPHTWG